MVIRQIRMCAGLVLIGISVASLWLGLGGMLDGEVAQFARQSREVLLRSSNPQGFWLSVLMWLLGGVALGVGGLAMVRRNRV